MKVDFLILGAGVSGLTFATQIKNNMQNSYLVIEKEQEPGGLCRSTMVDGFPFDIGGGHFLDTKRKKVTEFLFQYMPEQEWNFFLRDSRIQIDNELIGHPFEANIWQMQLKEQVLYLKSIAKAGCNNDEDIPEKFVNWISWKLGDRIAEKYMLPYNQKMFGKELNQLGTYWLEKLPNVSFEETLLSCLSQKAYGTQPGHAQFYYPKKYGYGEVWKRIANELGDKVLYNSKVEKIDFDTKTVFLSNGMSISAEVIITTIPWTDIKEYIGMPIELSESIKELKYSSIETKYFEETLDTEAHWIYYPDPQLSYHRILVRSNFSLGSKGYWTETNKYRVEKDKNNNFSYLNEYAYPLNTVKKPQIIAKVLDWAKSRNVYGLGRWGEWEHYNSDVTVERAMVLADEFCN